MFLAVAWSVLCSFSAMVTFPFSEKWGTLTHQTWGRGLIALLGINLKIQGIENLPKGGVVAPNHESMFDMFVLACLPIHYRWISKESIGRIPVIGWAMRSMGCFFVRRDRTAHDLNVMREVERALREGATVVIFPEGTRSRTGELLPFKKGAFRTALNAGVPLIPMAISGTRNIAPPGRLPAHRGHGVTLTIGPALCPPPGTPLETMMGDYRRLMETMLRQNPPQKSQESQPTL